MAEDDLKRVLGIDFGSRRVGVAVSDPLFLMSSPLITLPNDNLLTKNLKKIVSDKNIILIILGFPFKDDGTASSNAGDIIKFKTHLEHQTKLEIILWDERYTSEMAKDLVVAGVAKKSRRREKGLIDRGAAAIILQEFLDTKREELRKIYL
jgi:putative Holliday junction resolvase